MVPRGHAETERHHGGGQDPPLAQEGRRQGRDRQTLAEVETDKATVEMEAYTSGVILKLSRRTATRSASAISLRHRAPGRGRVGAARGSRASPRRTPRSRAGPPAVPRAPAGRPPPGRRRLQGGARPSRPPRRPPVAARLPARPSHGGRGRHRPRQRPRLRPQGRIIKRDIEAALEQRPRRVRRRPGAAPRRAASARSS